MEKNKYKQLSLFSFNLFGLKLFSQRRQRSFFMPKHNFFWYMQILIQISTLTIGKLFLNLEIRGLDNIDKLPIGGGALFVANHHGKIDPFLVGSCLPRSHYNKIKCLRFFTYYGYIRKKPYGPLIWLSGAYSVQSGQGIPLNFILKRTINILKNKQDVVMFPTARMRKYFDPREARPGVAYLAEEANPVIVPVFLANTNRIKLKDLILRRRQVKVIYGKPFYFKDLTGELSDKHKIAAMIMKRVENLGKELKREGMVVPEIK